MRVGLRQGCVMSPWLFNLYIDGVVRKEVRVVFSESGAETGMCDVAVAVQFVY